MSFHHKLETTTADFSISILAGYGPARKRRFGYFSRFTPRSARVLVATAIMLVLGQPLFAQQTVDTRKTNAAVVSGSHPNAAGVELAEAPRPTSEAGKGSAANGAALLSGTGTIFGTVVDVNGGLVPGATVVLNASSSDDRREVTADDSAAFKFDSVKPGIPYEVTIPLLSG